MFITIELLNKMPSGARACNEAREWFEETFPQGGKLEEVWSVCNNNEWKVWFTCHYLLPEQRQALAFRFAGQAMRFAGIQEFADNVTENNLQDAIAAAWDAAGAWAAAGAGAAAGAAAGAGDAAWAAAWAGDAAGAGAADAAGDAAGDAAANAAANEQAWWCWEALQWT